MFPGEFQIYFTDNDLPGLWANLRHPAVQPANMQSDCGPIT
ncbi:MAG: hypothetical protein K0R65_2949 [Crocinitomicaceae bacterium]|jgi:hypothetical protein|nr:hypothetical protein [Crocinitomicaceae bacterium]